MPEDLRRIKKTQVRRGIEESLSETNPFLKNGEICFETDTGKFKIGNGEDNWNDLVYFTNSESGGEGGGSSSYTPDNEDDWPDAPETITEAVDILASRLTAATLTIPFVDTYSSGNTTVIATGYPTGIYCYDVSVGKTINLSTPDIKYVGLVWSIISSDQNSGDITVPGVMGETLSIAPGYIVQIVGFWRDDIEAPAWRVLAGWPITSDFVAS